MNANDTPATIRINDETTFRSDTVRTFIPLIEGHTDVHTGNVGYLTNVAKRATVELMGFSPLMAHPDDEGVTLVNVRNLSKGTDDSYTVRFEGDTAVSCTCKADMNYDTCKHRVRTEDRLGADVATFVAGADDSDTDTGGVVLNRYEGTDATVGTLADGLANLRAIKGD